MAVYPSQNRENDTCEIVPLAATISSASFHRNGLYEAEQKRTDKPQHISLFCHFPCQNASKFDSSFFRFPTFFSLELQKILRKKTYVWWPKTERSGNCSITANSSFASKWWHCRISQTAAQLPRGKTQNRRGNNWNDFKLFAVGEKWSPNFLPRLFVFLLLFLAAANKLARDRLIS